MAQPGKVGGGIHLRTLDAIQSPPTWNVELEASGTVYSQELDAPIRAIDIQASGSYNVQIAFTNGDIEAEKGWTVFANSSYAREFDQPWSALTIYMKSDYDDTEGGEASRGVQILEWSG